VLAQVNRSSSSTFATGRQLRPATRFSLKRKAPHATVAGTAEGATKEFADRFRLNNLSPQKGARRQEKRKGRGYGSGQVGAHHAATGTPLHAALATDDSFDLAQGGTCGFGMRGQKARSGSGVRHGFEGGQTPLFRRLPKLKGIAGGQYDSCVQVCSTSEITCNCCHAAPHNALVPITFCLHAGMSAGLPKYITVNLSTLSKKFSDGEEVSLESLTQKRMLNLSGREAKLPLKVLLKFFHLLQNKPDLIVGVSGASAHASNPVCLCMLFHLSVSNESALSCIQSSIMSGAST